ncbi:unnamed protein product [Chondrus crispus]|uniref:Uncharacterized protein n=1 Tax=Chondrus crispus TaxID=2769 RepID=S0F374_CHOCR|nr:unnamed protein product [Chondrus crispus]CDF77482.1 unnamed protein product [Chondrus crispus]|eukprot:XP_005712356.1 unnamed protein product [Chondrus crispus]
MFPISIGVGSLELPAPSFAFGTCTLQIARSTLSAILAASSKVVTAVLRTSRRTSYFSPVQNLSHFSPSKMSGIVITMFRNSDKYFETDETCFSLRSLSRTLRT